MWLSALRGINLIPDTVCKLRLCRRLHGDLRENPTKQWAPRDPLIQSAGSISNSACYYSDANIVLGPILKMYFPGQIRISKALNSDCYSTGNAPPSSNNDTITPQVQTVSHHYPTGQEVSPNDPTGRDSIIPGPHRSGQNCHKVHTVHDKSYLALTG